MGFGLFKLNMHLGKPHRFYRGFYNMRWSPVSREIAGVSLFFTGLAGFTFFALFSGDFASLMNSLFALLGLAGAVMGGYFMYKLYRIPARPFWNHWHTGASFLGTGLTLGPILMALVALLSGAMTKDLATVLSSVIAAGLLLEMIALLFHAHDMQKNGDEGAVSHYEQVTAYAYPYWLRNGLLLVSLLLAAGIVYTSATDPFVFGLLSFTTLSAAILGRALFYVLVIPTTMPGAFFWRNKGFVEHARDTGLADMPQVGVVYEGHHAFDMKELVSTMRNTKLEEVLGQLRAIFQIKE